MGIVELFLVAVGLSADAFAVAVCKGLSVQKLKTKHALLTGIYFGGFQALMPLIGYLLGSSFQTLISGIDHWIAFLLLGIIGVNMIKEAREEEECFECSFSFKSMFPLAVATSIDALAVGITFAFLKVKIFYAVSLIGLTTFVLSVAGCFIGHRFGALYKSKAEITGGIILIGMGIKILLEHLGFIS